MKREKEDRGGKRERDREIEIEKVEKEKERNNSHHLNKNTDVVWVKFTTKRTR